MFEKSKEFNDWLSSLISEGVIVWSGKLKNNYKILDVYHIAATRRLQDRLVLQIEKIVHPAIGVRVCPAHKAVTDHSDIQLSRLGIR